MWMLAWNLPAFLLQSTHTLPASCSTRACIAQARTSSRRRGTRCSASVEAPCGPASPASCSAASWAAHVHHRRPHRPRRRFHLRQHVHEHRKRGARTCRMRAQRPSHRQSSPTPHSGIAPGCAPETCPRSYCHHTECQPSLAAPQQHKRAHRIGHALPADPAVRAAPCCRSTTRLHIALVVASIRRIIACRSALVIIWKVEDGFGAVQFSGSPEARVRGPRP